MVRRDSAPALIGLDLDETGAMINKLPDMRYRHPVTEAKVEIVFYHALARFYQLALFRLQGNTFGSRNAPARCLE